MTKTTRMRSITDEVRVSAQVALWRAIEKEGGQPSPDIVREGRAAVEAVFAEALAANAPADGLRERVIEQLVKEGRAKKCSLNNEQREAADDEARAFYGKVIDRYIAALSEARSCCEAERERAAKIADAYAENRYGGSLSSENRLAASIATAIRGAD